MLGNFYFSVISYEILGFNPNQIEYHMRQILHYLHDLAPMHREDRETPPEVPQHQYTIY